MLNNVKQLLDTTIIAQDGEIGQVDDVLFDGRDWMCRYMIINGNDLLKDKKAVIHTQTVEEDDWEKDKLKVSMKLKDIKNGPSVESRQFVSREHEIELSNYYGWKPYWENGNRSSQKDTVEHDGSSLRSLRELIGYAVEAEDGAVGHIEDLIAEEKSWDIRYAVVNLRDISNGHKIILSVAWIKEINWDESTVVYMLSKDTIKSGPKYNHDRESSEKYEKILLEHFSDIE